MEVFSMVPDRSSRAVRILVSVLAFGMFFMGAFLSKGNAIDLSVISNQTALFFKVAYVPLGSRGLASKETSYASELILKDLKESGYFEIEALSGPVKKSLSNMIVTGESSRTLAGSGIEGIIGAQFIRDGEGTHLIGVVRDPVNGSALLSKQYTTSGNIRVVVHRFVDEIIYQFTGFKGVAEGKIAFIGKNKRHGYDLYAMDFDGEGLHRLTYDRVLAYSPAWSLRLHSIIYTSYLHQSPQILRYDLTTGRRFPLARFSGLNITPSLTRSGKTLAMALSKNDLSQHTEIYDYSFKDRHFEQLTFSRNNNLSPSWSPGGNQLAFVSDRDGHPQIFVMDSDGSNVHRITFSGFYNVSPSWSPQGDLIAYVCMNENHRPKICLTVPEGGKHVQITHGPGQDDSPDWSPDGRTLIFTHQVKGHSYLEKMFMDGSHEHRIGTFPRSVITPVWAIR